MKSEYCHICNKLIRDGHTREYQCNFITIKYFHSLEFPSKYVCCNLTDLIICWECYERDAGPDYVKGVNKSATEKYTEMVTLDQTTKKTPKDLWDCYEGDIIKMRHNLPK